jgi:hypothetical protein
MLLRLFNWQSAIDNRKLPLLVLVYVNVLGVDHVVVATA